MLTVGQYLGQRVVGPEQPACPAEAVDDATLAIPAQQCGFNKPDLPIF